MNDKPLYPEQDAKHLQSRPEIDMSGITYSSTFEVLLVDVMGSDERICQAARVSTLGAASLDTEESHGLIKFLMKNRHGSPFEHGTMTFRIKAPIFVWREFMRHRIGFSYNEQSGRYMEMLPEFYVPGLDRPVVQEGKAGEYSFSENREILDIAIDTIVGACDLAWHNYKHMLNCGVAKEVARMCLPVNTYSTAYVTCNPRSLMSFLSLRTKSPISMFPSFPQFEIEQVAMKMEEIAVEKFPLTLSAFQSYGRVSP